MINYARVIEETNSKMFNVLDEYKNNTVEENVSICRRDSLPFSVGVINVTGCLNVGMILRSASLMGASNFYIFGRRKFDRRSTVGAENYINIVQYTFDDPLHADCLINEELLKLNEEHQIVLCDTGGYELSSKHTWAAFTNPLFIFGSESHGIPECITNNFWHKVSIPQRGVLRSFNVSAAMNIICWDYLKETYL